MTKSKFSLSRVENGAKARCPKRGGPSRALGAFSSRNSLTRGKARPWPSCSCSCSDSSAPHKVGGTKGLPFRAARTARTLTTQGDSIKLLVPASCVAPLTSSLSASSCPLAAHLAASTSTTHSGLLSRTSRCDAFQPIKWMRLVRSLASFLSPSFLEFGPEEGRRFASRSSNLSAKEAKVPWHSVVSLESAPMLGLLTFPETSVSEHGMGTLEILLHTGHRNSPSATLSTPMPSYRIPALALSSKPVW